MNRDASIERGVRRCFDQRQSLGVRGFTLLRHPGESRGPVLFARWIPACAGMTSGGWMHAETKFGASHPPLKGRDKR